MSKYEELKYVLSGATDCGYEYAKKEDVEAAFAELEERHAMELDQWVLELGKTKVENERLKKDIDTLKTAWEQSQSALSTIAALKLAAEEKLRATRRALWLARTESAKNAKCRYYRLAQKAECDPQPHGWSCYINGEVYPSGKMSRKLEPHYWCDIWVEVERKCRTKAEEYK